ncbi:MAG: hypothetical protein BWY85_01549 [Firmicutes bacterium ADurb.Bin506]|nr:MAG: hypothetical protein BWY85_01549 [Firmicutes bacterium ADurb.Bin506]
MTEPSTDAFLPTTTHVHANDGAANVSSAITVAITTIASRVFAVLFNMLSFLLFRYCLGMVLIPKSTAFSHQSG